MPPRIDVVRPAASRKAAARSARVCAACALLILARSAGAQQDTAQKHVPDSLRAHRLSEVVVTGEGPDARPIPFATTRVASRGLQLRDPTSVADAVRLIPGAHVQTNSRGETLIYLRNAAERQVSVFLDGALLNIPWDNRVDVSLVPAAVIDGITVAKGVPPVEYGANAIGGAVNLVSKAPDGGEATSAFGRAGTAAQRHVGALHSGGVTPILYEVAATYTAGDGFPLPDGADLAFSQPRTDLRVNTDARLTNVFARGIVELDGSGEVGVSLLHVDGEKGVAPQGHLDPAVANVRFWRYPLWRYTLGVVGADGFVGDVATFKATAWVGHFRQHITQYSSVSYLETTDRQEDDDLTIGGRAVVRHALGAGTIKFAANALTSRHRQQDLALEPGGAVAPGPPGPTLSFRQHVVSGGVEYTFPLGGGLIVTLGGAIDAMFAPETGDKPSIDPFVEYTVTGGAVQDLGEGWFLRAAAGRKTRFPTMRELFGEVLNRFLVNPALEPEASFLAEIGIGHRGATVSAEIVPFVAITSNTIDQRNVLVAGETSPRRQRINLRGSHVVGVELVAQARPLRALDLGGHVTLSRPRRRPDGSGDPAFLAEKPEILARAGAGYRMSFGLRLALEAEYTGRAYSPNEDDTFIPLPTALVVNARVSQTLELGPTTVEVYARGDNVADTVVVPQLGLPGPGRSVSGGAMLTF